MELEGDWDCGRVARRSEANICIMTRRWWKEAGLGALSAFWVARRRRRRFGEGEGCVSWRSAEVAMCRWARVGGLKDESRT